MTALFETGSPSIVLTPARTGERLARLWRGRPEDPVWVRPSLWALLAGTALLYLWDLSASGWGNAFYSAAAQAGSKSWEAWLFGSSDAANSITVDKPPAALWVMGLSARLFGVNSWSVLAPQALEGVAAVGMLYLTVRRCASASAGLIAGAVFALTPVAVLMFRFNNPDALLVLLLVGSVYCVVRALESASTRWLVGAGICVGFGFLTKQLQAFLVLPVLAPVYLYAAPASLGRRVRQLLLAGLATAVAGGWWVALVALTPASMRPFVGGSQNNSILELTFGYNGLGRLTGAESGSVGGGGVAGSRWGQTGWLRMFNAEFGSQASYLIPGALVLLVAGLWLTRRAPRTSLARAGLLLWGGWLVVTGVTFGLAQGIIHPYYAVALAPAIGALVGIGAVQLWSARRAFVARLGLAAAVAATAWWTVVLLDRAPTWQPWLRPTVAAAGVLVALALVTGLRLPRRYGTGLVAVGLAAAIAAPAAASAATAAVPHTGALPSASPVVQGAGFGGRVPGGFARGGPPSAAQLRQFLAGRPGGFGGPGGAGGGPGGGFGGARGGLGGLLDAGTVAPALVTALQKDASRYTWAAAAVGSNSAAGPQLASGEPVMAIGGFNGTDPSPTLAAFQALVSAGKIHYFLGGGGGGGRAGGGFGGSASTGTATQITTWVTATFPATTIGGTTVYDLTQPTG